MYSILKTTIGLAAAMLVAGGCESTNQYPIARLNPTPIHEDEAMALRQWDQTQALYANGRVTAYPTLFPYRTDPANGDEVNALWAPWVFLGQTLALPVTALVTPPWEETVSRGVSIPPSFTADVPLEPVE